MTLTTLSLKWTQWSDNLVPFSHECLTTYLETKVLVLINHVVSIYSPADNCKLTYKGNSVSVVYIVKMKGLNLSVSNKTGN